MAKYLFVYRGSGDAMAKMTREEQQQHMKKWEKWIGEAMQKGWMLNPGDALTPEGCVVNAKQVVTDGPFVETKEIIGGFSIIEVATIEVAAELAKGCPNIPLGGTVESQNEWDFFTPRAGQAKIPTSGTSLRQAVRVKAWAVAPQRHSLGQAEVGAG